MSTAAAAAVAPVATAPAGAGGTLPRAHRVVRWPGWYKFVRHELAPLPDRAAITLRMVVTNVIVTILSMTLQVPNLGISAYVATLFAKSDLESSTRGGVVMSAGVVTACLICLAEFHYSLDYAQSRLAFMALGVFVGMFVLRATKLGVFGWVAAMFTAVLQGSTDSHASADVVVRSALYFTVFFMYPAVVVIVVSRFVLPNHPWESLVRGWRHRLDLAITMLQGIAREGVVGGRDDLAARSLASRGAVAAFGTLAQAEARHPELKARHDALTAAIVASAWIARASGNLQSRERVALTGNDRQCVEVLLAECHRLREETGDLGINPPDGEIGSLPAHADLPELVELQSAVTALRVSLNIKEPPDAAAAPAKSGLFKKDAFTNPAYTHYALKITLATAISYVLYSAVNWPGLSTALFTCTAITFEGNNEGTLRKGLLRIFGCLTGGAVGFLSLTFLVPHMTSIGSLCLLSAVVTAVGGWIAAGGANTSYFGGQMVYAFYLGIYQGYTPSVSYSGMRDRIVGILLGLVVSSFVYANLWPERAVSTVRPSLAGILRSLAQLVLLPRPDQAVDEAHTEAQRLRRTLPAALGSSWRLIELSEDEPDEPTPAARGVYLAMLPNVLAQAQAIFLLENVLATSVELSAWEQLPASARAAEADLRQGIAGLLRAVADTVETGTAARADDAEAALSAWRSLPSSQTGQRAAMLERLAVRARQLHALIPR